MELHTAPVGRRSVEIGQLAIRVNKSNEETVVLALKAKARALGADAIILLGERSTGAVAIPVGTMAVAVPLRSLVAIAIRYAD